MMEQKTNKAREMERIRKEIIRDAHISEGTMIAFPLCFPGASAPIPGDESHITALDMGPEGFVYGGASGRKSHIFVGMFHGELGAVFDMGAIENANHCAAICCGHDKFFAFVNGDKEGRIISGKLQKEPDQLIQEWGFVREPLQDHGLPFSNEKIIHAVRDKHRSKAIGVTMRRVFSVDFSSGQIKTIAEMEGRGRLALGSGGNIFGKNTDRTLWRYNCINGEFTADAVRLPDAVWKISPSYWPRHPGNGSLYITDDEGNLYLFSEEKEFSEKLGTVPLLPVGPMAVTNDGRLFGFCGEGIAHFFSYDPEAKKIEKHGVAVSYLERRRYGYEWGDAVTGRDGQIFFGEKDNLGHIWIYFPAIRG
jgi:ribosomal protein L24E